MGLIQSLVSAYERGVLRLNAEMLIRFAIVLEISSDYLLGFVPPQSKNVFPKKLTTRMSGIMKTSEATQKYILRLIDVYLVGEKSQSEPDIDATEQQKPRIVPTSQTGSQGQSSGDQTHTSDSDWLEQDREMLRMYYPRLGKKEILELFPKRQWADCVREAERLVIKRLILDDLVVRPKAKPGKRGHPREITWPWTEEDRAIIKKLYPYRSKSDILLSLKHRTWHAIQKEASRLGIKRIFKDEGY